MKERLHKTTTVAKGGLTPHVVVVMVTLGLTPVSPPQWYGAPPVNPPQ